MGTIEKFQNDLKVDILEACKELEIKIPKVENFDDFLVDYLTVRFKYIDCQPRQVLINPDFFEEFLFHEKRPIIDEVIKLAKWGGNLNQFQSKRIDQCKFHDHLMNEWKIYHFHLSLKRDKNKKFVKQVNDLLFVHVTNQKFIVLGISKHQYGIFGDMKWVEILHEHFPEHISDCKTDVKYMTPTAVNSKDRQMFWDKGFSLPHVNIKGQGYFSFGLGSSTSGHSKDVVMTSGDIIRWIYKISTQLDELRFLVCSFLDVDIKNAVFSLKLYKKDIILYEETTSLKLLSFPEEFIDKEEIEQRIRMKNA